MQTATSPDVPQGVRQVEIGPERDGQRIDNALVTLLKGVTAVPSAEATAELERLLGQGRLPDESGRARW